MNAPTHPAPISNHVPGSGTALTAGAAPTLTAAASDSVTPTTPSAPAVSAGVQLKVASAPLAWS